MTIQQLLNSQQAIQKLMGFNLPVKKAYKIYALAKQINEQREFFINEERKLIKKFNAEIKDNGYIILKDPQKDSEPFAKEYQEICSCEIPGISPIELKYSDFGDATLSPQEIALLDGIITFVE